MEYEDYSLPDVSLDDILVELKTPSDGDPMDIDDAALRKESDTAVEDNATLTDNSAAAYKSSLSACLDFFYKVKDGGREQQTEELLAAAWKEDANITLRLIFHLRDIRNGKGVHKPFLFCLHWMKEHHFQTLMCNLKHIADVGCWKDLLDLLVVGVVGTKKYEDRCLSEKGRAAGVRKWLQNKKARVEKQDTVKVQTKGRVFDPKARIDKNAAAKAARAAFLENREYQHLHVRIAALFAEALKKDLASMKEKKSVSLAAKWAPTASKHHDKFTLIVSTISQLLFPKKDLLKEGRSYESYISIARDLYRKVYLTPLRQYSDVIERFMSDKRWSEIPFERVPSKCMKRNKKNFVDKDKERFEKYLEEVEAGKKTIKASALNPHELVKEVLYKSNDMDEAVLTTIQLQWEAYVSKMRESGTLSNCMSVCDVSGSMSGTPIVVAIALSLLVADLAEEPFKGLICTFSSVPALFRVPDGTLDTKAAATSGMDWGLLTNVDAVFDLILDRALEANIPQEAMIKRLFIFSDMQFKAASDGQQTNFDVAKNKFNASGYDLPQIVFWNLRGDDFEDTTVPVVKSEKDTALVSGYSGQLLKLFMEGKIETFDPISIMITAIESYTYLRVID